MSQPSPAVISAKEKKSGENTVFELSNGVKVRILPVSATLIDEVVSRIDDPVVPNFYNEDKGREEPNPNDPAYLKAMAASERARGIAAMDAMIMFGVELIDGVPESGSWIKKLDLLAKMGHVDLTPYDTEDPIDLEFLYKRFILANTELFDLLSNASSLSEADIQKAEKSFPSNEEGTTDQPS